MRFNLKKQWQSLTLSSEALLRMTLILVLYAFMGVALKVPMALRIEYNSFYTLYLQIGFIFWSLWIYSLINKYFREKNVQKIIKKYNIDIIP